MHVDLAFETERRPETIGKIVESYVASRTLNGTSISFPKRLAEIQRFTNALVKHNAMPWDVKAITAESYLTTLKASCKFLHPMARSGTGCIK
jgi:hypothetical protein